MGGLPEKGREVRGGAPLGRVLEDLLAKISLGPQYRQQLALMAWPQIAGPTVAAHARAEAVRDGVLIVLTDSPAWAQELQLRRRDLVARVGAQVGEGVIRDIRFRSGRGRREAGKAGREPKPSEMRLSGRQQRDIKRAAAHIEAPELRERAERAFVSLTRLAKWRRQTGWRRCRRCGTWQRVGRRWCASCAITGRRRKT